MPIAGATVFIDENRQTLTDALGTYIFGSVPAGDWTVTVSQTGYATQTASVTISSGNTKILDFALVPPLNTVPEIPWGTLAASLAMIVALTGYIAIPKLRKRT